MKTPDDFFIPDNELKLPDEIDYSRSHEYIRSAEAFSRSTYQSVYIIDYFKQNFLYVSPNPMFLCNLTPVQMIDIGYQFYVLPDHEVRLADELDHSRVMVIIRKCFSISLCVTIFLQYFFLAFAQMLLIL